MQGLRSRGKTIQNFCLALYFFVVTWIVQCMQSSNNQEIKSKAEILYGFTPASESLHAFWVVQTCLLHLQGQMT